MLPKVDEVGEYKISGRTLNALIDAANSWENLRVELVVSTDDVTRMIRAPGGATLRIVIPPQTSTGGGVSYRELSHSITVAGTVPTTTEISNALAATYTDPDPDLVPADGDFILLTVSGTPKLAARITTQAITASGPFVRSFVVNSVTYYAVLAQLGVY